MRVDIPDYVVWAIMGIAIVGGTLILGIKIGKQEVGFTAAPRNIGSPAKKNRKKKSKSEGSPLSPIQTPLKKNDDVDNEDEGVLDDGETSAETRSEVAPVSPASNPSASVSGGESESIIQESSNMSHIDKAEPHEKGKNKKKNKKVETAGLEATNSNSSVGIETEKQIEKEVVTESASQVVMEEISDVATAAVERNMTLTILKEAQEEVSEENVLMTGNPRGGMTEVEDEGEWEVVEKRSAKNPSQDKQQTEVAPKDNKKDGKGDKVKKEKTSQVPSSSSSSLEKKVVDNAPPVAIQVITVDMKHLGAVIGTKGTTRLGLEKLYNTEIKVPKSERSGSGPIDITITGQEEGVKYTISAIHQLCEKGYATCLGGEGFSEGAVQVHPIFVPEIVGRNQTSRRAIQDQMGVRLVIPQYTGKDQKDLIRVGVAGPKDKVKKAKEVIKDLIKYHHTEITHPGMTHLELEDVPVGAHSHIIGKKGTEIKRINAQFDVDVYIPYEHSMTKNVVLVGKEQDNLQAASTYIHDIVKKYEVSLKAKETGVSLAPADDDANADADAPAALDAPAAVDAPAVVKESSSSDIEAMTGEATSHTAFKVDQTKEDGDYEEGEVIEEGNTD